MPDSPQKRFDDLLKQMVQGEAPSEKKRRANGGKEKPGERPELIASALLDELLGPLHMHFRSARTAYQDYLANGRSFLWASSLRRINSAARSLLLAKGYLLPAELQDDAAALVRHYDVWLTLWDDLAERTIPALNDPFVFENSVTYPRDAEDRLEQLYAALVSA